MITAKTIKDKKFRPYISTQNIATEVSEAARFLNRKFKHTKEPVLFIAVLDGASVFASNLLTRLKFPVLFDTVRAKSYKGTERGEIKIEYNNKYPAVRDVIIVEDIIESGNTIKSIKEYFRSLGYESIYTVALLKRKWHNEDKDTFCCITIGDGFVVGYGMDYDGLGRNLNKIYIETNDIPEKS